MDDFFAPAPAPTPEAAPIVAVAAVAAEAGPVPTAIEEAAGKIKPTLLVSQDGANLRVHDEGLDLLRALGTAPVATVAVAGMYRTGKSFLLNQLCGGHGDFTVGNTTSSCTRGIWVCVVPPELWFPPPGASPGTRLVVLDTEGLASIDQDETYDAKIFSLGILLASYFVYNSMGVIDEAAIDRLFLVGELTKNISASVVKTNTVEGVPAEPDTEPAAAAAVPDGSEDDLAQFFPPFMWWADLARCPPPAPSVPSSVLPHGLLADVARRHCCMPCMCVWVVDCWRGWAGAGSCATSRSSCVTTTGGTSRCGRTSRPRWRTSRGTPAASARPTASGSRSAPSSRAGSAGRW